MGDVARCARAHPIFMTTPLAGCASRPTARTTSRNRATRRSRPRTPRAQGSDYTIFFFVFVFDFGLGSIRSRIELLVPGTVLGLIFDADRFARHALLAGRTLGRCERRVVTREGLREGAPRLVCPAILVLDDLVDDLRHRSLLASLIASLAQRASPANGSC